MKYRRRHPRPPDHHHPDLPPPPPPPPPPPGSTSVADLIAAEMSRKSEGIPAGWPWDNNPVVGMGNNPEGNGAAVQWGVIYVAESPASNAPNTRVNIRGCEIYWLQKSTNKWVAGTKSNSPLAELYAGNYAWGPESANVRKESDGSISVVPVLDDVVHFYPDRFAIKPNDLAGWAGIIQMRLILNNASGHDDRGNAHFLASSGADYYPSVGGPGIANNPGIVAGPQKFVRNDWRFYGFTTLSKQQLESNQPPFNLTGLLP